MRKFLIVVEKAANNFSAYSPDLQPIPEPSAMADYVEVAS